METLLINGGFTIIGALIGFLGTFWVYHLQEKSKEKDKIIYYYNIMSQNGIHLRPFEVAEIGVLLYKKSKNKKFLEIDDLIKIEIKEELEKYI